MDPYQTRGANSFSIGIGEQYSKLFVKFIFLGSQKISLFPKLAKKITSEGGEVEGRVGPRLDQLVDHKMPN